MICLDQYKVAWKHAYAGQFDSSSIFETHLSDIFSEHFVGIDTVIAFFQRIPDKSNLRPMGPTSQICFNYFISTPAYSKAVAGFGSALLDAAFLQRNLCCTGAAPCDSDTLYTLLASVYIASDSLLSLEDVRRYSLIRHLVKAVSTLIHKAKKEHPLIKIFFNAKLFPDCKPKQIEENKKKKNHIKYDKNNKKYEKNYIKQNDEKNEAEQIRITCEMLGVLITKWKIWVLKGLGWRSSSLNTRHWISLICERMDLLSHTYLKPCFFFHNYSKFIGDAYTTWLTWPWSKQSCEGSRIDP
eukprot:GHVL01020747.1.p1 GENE.GHVL01020747.1~~GHVL01020747.1.p1  ORF type:complete len:322 (+),score=45.29 GHVL01020747.1:73-966(+)